jgi:hypothetical protein
MKKEITFAAAAVAVVYGALFAQERVYISTRENVSLSESCPTNKLYAVGRAPSAYDQGVNDALAAISLLALEQRLEGTNRTWGAMADIVRERLHVEKRQ